MCLTYFKVTDGGRRAVGEAGVGVGGGWLESGRVVDHVLDCNRGHVTRLFMQTNEGNLCRRYSHI